MDNYAQLLAELSKAGVLGEEWRGAFERAPRSAFIPDTVWAPDEHSPNGYSPLNRDTDPDRWWAMVNADGVVVTQLDDGAAEGPGVATSSASMPSLVASMLQHLDVSDGQKVLDIGTGTGWTAGLLATRLGPENVTTIELDRAVYVQAAASLATCKLLPGRQLQGDGLAGWPFGAPFDRIHSTAAVQQVPLAWLEQTRPGGIIVTPWGTPYANAGLLKLVAGGRGKPSHGRLVDDVSFMWMRAQRPVEVSTKGRSSASRGPSRMDPDLALESVHAAFAIGLLVPGARYVHMWDTDNPVDTYRMQISDGRGSWAAVRYRDWSGEDAVQQAGPRALWDEITSARYWWLDQGKPELTRFGVTVSPNGEQAVWLDHPDNPVR